MCWSPKRSRLHPMISIQLPSSSLFRTTVLAAKAFVPNPPAQGSQRRPPQGGRPPFDSNLHCLHCSRPGHHLLSCFEASKILSQHKQQGQLKSSDSNLQRQPHQAPKKTTQPAKAGRTSVVRFSHESNGDESEFDDSNVVVASSARALLTLADFSNQGPISPGDGNLNSGCSMSMTPFKDNVQHPSALPTDI